jgi:hypothetical protein
MVVREKDWLTILIRSEQSSFSGYKFFIDEGLSLLLIGRAVERAQESSF